jgi:transposase
MLNMSRIHDIKELSREGYTVAEIARKENIDEKTVRKYLSRSDFSPSLPRQKEWPSKLDPYKGVIDGWLAEDRKVWYKQRHTAKRIHDRLVAEQEDYSCSYEMVQRYVKRARQREREQRASQELVWHPGEAQADFGEADFIEQGQQVRKKYLVLSFPHSNDSFVQVFGGETAECVCQGLIDIFDYIRGVPPLVVFDNATGVGRRVGDVIHEAELFHRLRAHYNFSIRFCNPDAGHEKGNVETKIRYDRSNLFVPIPVYDDIFAYNQALLDKHALKASEEHYKKLVPIRQLFEEDWKALLPLPQIPFNACRYLYVKADGYGKVRLDDRHYYSTCPEYGGREVLVAVHAHTIDILGDERRILVRHSRQFGEQRTDSCDYRTSLAVLLRNVGAWKNSGVREILPASLRTAMDSQPREQLQETIRVMNLLTRTYNFETAIVALEEGLRINRTRFCDAAVLAARISGCGLAAVPARGPDLRSYDILLKRGERPC